MTELTCVLLLIYFTKTKILYWHTWFQNPRSVYYRPEPSAPSGDLLGVHINVPRPPICSTYEIEPRKFAYAEKHVRIGTGALFFGTFIMIFDPLIPIFLQIYGSSFGGGLFLCIAGITSIHGGWNNNRCCLLNSIIFYALSCVAFIVGIVSYTIVIISYGSMDISYVKVFAIYSCCTSSIGLFVFFAGFTFLTLDVYRHSNGSVSWSTV